MPKSNYIDYYDQEVSLQGFMAFDDSTDEKRPAVLVVHDWSGRNQFACDKAMQLAKLGYVGFAVDMYGNGQVAETKEEKMKLMQPLVNDRELLLERIRVAFETVKELDQVDPSRIAVIGFCFGGLCALDLARSGADLAGVVSFHGTLSAPGVDISPLILAKILVLHGYADPMVTPEHVMQFCEEMTDCNADWELTMYGDAMHGFTNPDANDVESGIVYNREAAQRSWKTMEVFLKEVF